VWVCDWKLELLLFELDNNDRLRPRALDLLVGGSWVACHRKSELLVALLPCLATMTHGSVSCLCSSALCGWLVNRVLYGNLLVHKFFCLNS
jgi:hypothetical protein